MKIVINKCFGGFGLSYAACMRYAELTGIKLYAFTEATKANGTPDFHHHVSWNGEGKEPFCLHYSTKPLKPDGTYEKESYWAYRDIARDDPHLVQVVEEMASKSFGSCADLSVVEIPDGIEYEVEEYDGREWVSEPHRTWS